MTTLNPNDTTIAMTWYREINQQLFNSKLPQIRLIHNMYGAEVSPQCLNPDLFVLREKPRLCKINVYMQVLRINDAKIQRIAPPEYYKRTIQTKVQLETALKYIFSPLLTHVDTSEIKTWIVLRCKAFANMSQDIVNHANGNIQKHLEFLEDLTNDNKEGMTTKLEDITFNLKAIQNYCVGSQDLLAKIQSDTAKL